MKKLMFTFIVVALSGSSLFGVHRYQTRPLVTTRPAIGSVRQPQKAGVTAYDDPNLQDCLNAKGRSEQTLQECRDMVYGTNYIAGDAGKGVTHY